AIRDDVRSIGKATSTSRASNFVHPRPSATSASASEGGYHPVRVSPATPLSGGTQRFEGLSDGVRPPLHCLDYGLRSTLEILVSVSESRKKAPVFEFCDRSGWFTYAI